MNIRQRAIFIAGTQTGKMKFSNILNYSNTWVLMHLDSNFTNLGTKTISSGPLAFNTTYKKFGSASLAPTGVTGLQGPTYDTQNFAVELWGAIQILNSENIVFAFNNNKAIVHCGTKDDNKYYFVYYDRDTSTEYLIWKSDDAYPINEFHHLAFSYDNTNKIIKFFFDGILVAEENKELTDSTNSGNSASPLTFYNGYCDELVIHDYNRFTKNFALQTMPYVRDLNIDIFGSPTINNTIISDFSTSDYLLANLTKTVASPSSFEIKIKINTGSSGTSSGRIMNSYVASSDTTVGFFIDARYTDGYIALRYFNGSTYYDCIGLPIGLYSLNTDYYLKWTYDGTTIRGYYSTDGINYTLADSLIFTPYFNDIRYYIGNRNADIVEATTFKGSIDLSQCSIYVDSEYLWQGINFK